MLSQDPENPVDSQLTHSDSGNHFSEKHSPHGTFTVNMGPGKDDSPPQTSLYNSLVVSVFAQRVSDMGSRPFSACGYPNSHLALTTSPRAD